MNNAIPSKPSIVHDDMDLAITKGSRLIDQLLQVSVIQDVARDRDGAIRLSGVDLVGDGLRLGCSLSVLASIPHSNGYKWMDV